MTNKKFSIVTTTINNPVLLDDYANDCINHDYKDVSFIVIETRKPIKRLNHHESLNDKFNYDFQYFDVEKQNNYLEKYPELLNFLPWNCVQRRNVGMLFAYENNSDVIITIDDDNFIEREGYLDGHQNVGSTISLPVLETSSSWLNICDFLIDKNSREFFARGYPISERQISRAKKMNPLKVKRSLLMVDFG